MNQKLSIFAIKEYNVKVEFSMSAIPVIELITQRKKKVKSSSVFEEIASCSASNMEVAIVLVLCAVGAVNAQMWSPYHPMGMGSGWNNQMWGYGMRQPGVMQTSQLNSMTYPTWRTHPLFRVAVPPAETAKTVGGVGGGLLSDIINIPKIPGAHEVLTHMGLANPNPKPLYDTISDFLYEPPKAKQAVMAPMYLQGMNVMRANVPAEDCGPDGTRWERGMSDWVY